MRRTALMRSALFLCLLIPLFFGGTYLYHRAEANSLLPPDPHTTPYWDAFFLTKKIQPFFVEVGPGLVNGSGFEPLLLQSISLPNGLPAHLHVENEALLLYTDQPSGHINEFGSGTGWPPGAQGYQAVIHPFAGFQLGPLSSGEGLIEFVPDQPGVYIIGPFTVHALLPGFFGSSFGSVAVEVTYKEHDAICVQVTQTICNAALNSFKL